ncbi:hypothetical protein BCR44DRAFT_1423593 [Catenaria anguillulae PL171]|uniref:Uncharacterized protein n=1 Tax=Catenaria anguillulae PL171 TaxID=765915 RepID=A0A1Y2I584_9FUNG|nr:hypothetical protein BCR44DRAFT_1423593 [Catenaria anguillulae PL171]
MGAVRTAACLELSLLPWQPSQCMSTFHDQGTICSHSLSSTSGFVLPYRTAWPPSACLCPIQPTYFTRPALTPSTLLLNHFLMCSTSPAFSHRSLV